MLGKVKTADDADAIMYDRASNKVYVSCGDANSLVPVAADVDPNAGKADAAIDLGGKPEALASDGQGKVFVNLVDKNEVAVVDVKDMKVVSKWPVAPGGSPVGMAIDREHHRLFVGCRKPQKLVVMNTEDGHVIADLPIGVGCDATVFDGDIFASCLDGSLSVARETSPGKFEIVQTVKTCPAAKGPAGSIAPRTRFTCRRPNSARRKGRARPGQAEARQLYGPGREARRTVGAPAAGRERSGSGRCAASEARFLVFVLIRHSPLILPASRGPMRYNAGMTEPRRTMELRWLKNVRELCRLYEVRRRVGDFFAPCLARLKAEQERIERALANDVTDPATDPLRWIRDQRESDNLLEVGRIGGVIYVHPRDGSVSTASGRMRR